MFEQFMKKNKIKKENKKYAVTQSLKDENKKALEWEFKAISPGENDRIREDNTREIPLKNGLYKQKINTTNYLADLIIACTVYPNLHDKALQDSYGVYSARDLLFELVDNVGEYTALSTFIQELNGFNNLSEEVEIAKN